MDRDVRFGFVVEYAGDAAAVEAARRFYVDVMGLEVKRYHPTYVEFEHFAVAGDAPLSGDPAQGHPPELFWLVDDAEAAYRDLPDGTDVTVPLRRLPFGTVFGIRGPGGRPRYLLELATERPSQTVG